MIDKAESFAKWIPVVGTLGGATLGLSASFITTWFNNREINSRSKDDRNRHRLELIYELLIEIQNEYTSLMTKSILCVHYNEKIISEKNEKMPPLIKLEMMVSLYFPEFKEAWESLESAKNSFGEELADLISSPPKNLQLSEKQKRSAKFAVLERLIDKRVIEFQQAIVKSIKS